MSSRPAPKGKGKAPPSEPLDDEFPNPPSDDEGGQLGPSLDVQSNLLALQNAQVNQAITVKEVQKQMSALEQGMAQILAALNKPTPTVPSATPPQFAQVEPDTRASPTPSRDSSSQPNYNYKPKKKDPLKFDNNDGEVQYKAWKEQILDKFEEDAPQFGSTRSYMSYIFNCTKGDAQKHLYPRYTRDKRNQNPFSSYEDMLDTLDSIYLDVFEERDSRNAYRELKMTTRQSFQDFKTQFLHLANAGGIPEADRFDDIYDKMTTALQDKLLIHRQLINGDFNQLCTMAAGADSELKRLNIRRTQERKEREERLSKIPVSRPENRYTPSQPANSVAKPASAGFALLPRPSPALAHASLPVGTTSTQPAKLLESKCYNCFEPGHLSRDCPKPRRATVNDIEEDEHADVEEERDFEDQGKEDA
jgi:hypothetical protein